MIKLKNIRCSPPILNDQIFEIGAVCTLLTRWLWSQSWVHQTFCCWPSMHCRVKCVSIVRCLSFCFHTDIVSLTRCGIEELPVFLLSFGHLDIFHCANFGVFYYPPGSRCFLYIKHRYSIKLQRFEIRLRSMIHANKYMNLLLFM